jgi:micrococcal nuclease
MYQYKAIITNIVDGDTVDMQVDLGFKMTTVQRFRLGGINTPETRGPERELGKIAKAYMETLIPVGSEVFILTAKADSFGRYLVSIWKARNSLESVSQILVSKGYAVEWDGKGKRPGFDPAAPYPIVRLPE